MLSERPWGLVLIAIYSAFAGILSIIICTIALLVSAFPEFPLWLMALAIADGLIGCLLLVATYGLWTWQSWGASLTYNLYGISIVLSVISIFPIGPYAQFSVNNTVLQLVSITIALNISIYLKKHHIQHLFKLNN